MISIAFLIRSLDYGGAERYLLTLAHVLGTKGFSVTILYFYPGGGLENEFKASGARMICLDKAGRWDLLRFGWRLVRHLRAIRPRILHGFLVEPNLLAVFLKPLLRGTRIILGVRASRVYFENYDRFTRLSFRLQCLFSRFADLIIFNSDAGRAYHISEGFPARKSLVIYNGIDTEHFKPERESGRSVRARFGVPPDARLIGHVGRLDPMKDHPTFLRAASLLCHERDDVYFLCVGGGPEGYREELRRLAAELGIAEKVIWTGALSGMPAVYNALDLLASSSYSEGFPNVVGEAMACGVPCVVTDVGDSALIVADTGIVVEPKDAAALCAGLISCLERNPDEAGLRARARILENFSVERSAAQMSTALLRLETI
ncbi:MAG TPA: glycosyltransferase [Pyrinomonadaceae bacterium]|jgi:glycosyltransferase involved in cell wall biosynthesis|nr:glycosyltransferase [Pyrinomonadaceae bacterium]